MRRRRMPDRRGATPAVRHNRNGNGKSPFHTKNTPNPPHGQAVRLRDGRVAGEVVGDTFHKKVMGSRHRLQVPPAWAIDVDILMQAEALGARWVEVYDQESDELYHAPLSAFWQSDRQEFDRGWGRQRYVLLGDWQTGDEVAAEQMVLFEGMT